MDSFEFFSLIGAITLIFSSISFDFKKKYHGQDYGQILEFKKFTQIKSEVSTNESNEEEQIDDDEINKQNVA